MLPTPIHNDLGRSQMILGQYLANHQQDRCRSSQGLYLEEVECVALQG